MTGKKRPAHEREYTASGGREARPGSGRNPGTAERHPAGRKSKKTQAAKGRTKSGEDRSVRSSRPAGTPDEKKRNTGRKEPSAKGKKGRKKMRSRRKYFLWFFLGGVLLALIGCIAVFLFQIKEIQVTGNQYCTEQEVLDRIQEDPYSENALYLLWKYRKGEPQGLSAAEQVRVVLKAPWAVEIQIEEKEFSGRLDYEEQFLYFDRRGIASLALPDVIGGVPYITGMEIETDKVQMGKKLPVKEEKIFQEINELTELLKKRELFPDKIECRDGDLTLHFGGIRAQVGSSGFEERLAQIPPILEKMNELYADQTGVLHLENYSTSSAAIRFVPDSASGQQENSAL